MSQSREMDTSYLNKSSMICDVETKQYFSLVVGEKTFKSDISIDHEDSQVNNEVELTESDYNLFQQILEHARMVNLDPMRKFKVAVNTLVTSKCCELSLVNGFANKPDVVINNVNAKTVLQLGKPHKLYGSIIGAHVVIPTEYDPELKCYKCVCNKEIIDNETGEKVRYILVHENRLIIDYTLRNESNYSAFADMSH